MSDPAHEAARRAIINTPIVSGGRRTGRTATVAIAAAREALAPLRELHRKDNIGGGNYRCSHCVRYCEPVRHEDWPCATARLIYTTEELT